MFYVFPLFSLSFFYFFSTHSPPPTNFFSFGARATRGRAGGRTVRAALTSSI